MRSVLVGFILAFLGSLPLAAGPLLTPPAGQPVHDVPRATAEGSALSLRFEQAWHLTLAHSPVVAAALARVTQAREQTEIVAAPARPQATLSGFREQTRTTPGPPMVLSTFGMRPAVAGVVEDRAFQSEAFEYGSSQLQFEVRQLLFDGGYLAARIASTRALEGQAEAALQGAVRNLRRDLEKAWLDVLEARSRVYLAEEAEKLSREQQRMTESRFKEGTAARADVVFARVPVARAVLDRVQVENSAAVAQAALNRLLGLPLGTALVLDEPPPLRPLDGTVEEVEEQACQARAEVVSARSALESAQKGLLAARSGREPQLYAVGATNGVAYDKDLLPGNPGWRVALEARWDLLDGNLSAHQVRRARARILEAQADLAEACDSVSLQVRQAWLEFETAERALCAAGIEVERAEEALAMAEGRYQSGISVFLEVSQARVDLLTARANRAAARYALLRARSGLDWACGAQPPG